MSRGFWVARNQLDISWQESRTSSWFGVVEALTWAKKPSSPATSGSGGLVGRPPDLSQESKSYPGSASYRLSDLGQGITIRLLHKVKRYHSGYRNIRDDYH